MRWTDSLRLAAWMDAGVPDRVTTVGRAESLAVLLLSLSLARSLLFQEEGREARLLLGCGAAR